MLVDVKPRLRDGAVQELIGHAVFPDPERLEQTIRTYEMNAGYELYGTEEDGSVIAIAGIVMDEENRLEIKHIAVQPDRRGEGLGRELVLALIELKNPQRIVAETDDEAVDFYRSIGFTIESLGETYPGTERFRCTYVTEPED